MSDSEYDSEEDEDYVPEESASEEEEIGDDGKNRKRKKKKDEKEKSLKRKRKGGIKLDEEEPEDASDGNGDESEEACEDLEEQEKEKQNEELSKARVDDLWAAFKRDTADVRSAKKQPNESGIKNKDSQNKPSSSLQTSVTPKEKTKKVEITEIFDFAGEEVKVVKSVDASSIKVAPKSDKEKPEEDSNNTTSNPAIMKKKSVGGLGNVLGKLGKKPKLSTLEKSKLDWSEFKKEKGIEDELKTLNKDGYLEKKAFLDRVDHKQFEIERDVRLGVRKR